MTRPSVILAATTAAAWFTSMATALDVEIESYECDSNYAVSADIYLDCNGSARCTFGKQITVYGNLHYSGVANTGVQGETGYLSAELSLFSIDFSLVNKQAVPLCYFENEDGNNQNKNNWQGGESGYYDQNGYMENQEQQQDQYNYNNGQGQEDNNNNNQEQYYNYAQYCPNDGSYPFKIHYVLPSAGSESASWMASGWTGTGLIEMFAQRNDNMKIGECTLTLSTYVTKKDQSSLLGTPSAAATAGIIIAIVAASFLMCFYCYCCIKSKKTRKSELDIGDDVTSNFRRMDTDIEEHSKPGTISLDARSQATSKKSAKEMV